jgi:hypothetical protein
VLQGKSDRYVFQQGRREVSTMGKRAGKPQMAKLYGKAQQGNP